MKTEGFPDSWHFIDVREYLDHCRKNGHVVHLFHVKYLLTKAYLDEAYDNEDEDEEGF